MALMGIGPPSTSFVARTSMHVGNRAMVVTAHDSLIGLVPKGTQAGDAVVVLEGGNVPFVMRPVGSSGEWQIIGACYMHGCMHGEKFRPEKCVNMVIV